MVILRIFAISIALAISGIAQATPPKQGAGGLPPINPNNTAGTKAGDGSQNAFESKLKEAVTYFETNFKNELFTKEMADTYLQKNFGTREMTDQEFSDLKNACKK